MAVLSVPMLITTVILFGLGGKGIEIVFVNFLMTLIFGIISALYTTCVIKLKPKIGKVEKKFVIEIFSYSVIIFIQMIATQINAMADQVIIGVMIPLSSTILGVYAIGAQFNTYLHSFAGAINGILMPGVVRMVNTTNDAKEIGQEMVRIGRIIFALLGFIYASFCVMGKEFIILWVGADNINAYYVAVIIMLPTVIVLSQSIGSQIIWAMDKHKAQAILQIAVALSNVIFTVYMVKWDPLIGASVATAIAYFIGNIVVQNIIYVKYIGVSMKRYYIGLFKGIAGSIIFSSVVLIFAKRIIPINGWAEFFINGLIVVVAYGVALYLFGMNGYEKSLIKSIIKIKKKGENNV